MWQVIKSALASLCGIQSHSSRASDFSGKTPLYQFIAAGLCVLAGLVGSIVLLVYVIVSY